MKEEIVMEKCMSVPFDQYQRYRNIANLIDHYRNDSKKTFSILEIVKAPYSSEGPTLMNIWI